MTEKDIPNHEVRLRLQLDNPFKCIVVNKKTGYYRYSRSFFKECGVDIWTKAR